MFIKFKSIFWAILAFLILCLPVCSQEPNLIGNTYAKQLQRSGGAELEDALPQETKNFLNDIGISLWNPQNIVSLKSDNAFKEIFKLITGKSKTVFSDVLPVFAVVIICAVIGALNDSSKNNYTPQILAVVGNLCLCVCLSTPLVRCFNSAALILNTASGFMLCLAPIMAGIMVAMGRGICATSYSLALGSVCQFVAYAAGHFLVPIMSTMLGITFVSAISPRLRFDRFCEFLNKLLRMAIKFSAFIFSGVVSLQNFVANSADGLGAGAAKLAIDSCVPVVGGALSDAFGAMRGCVRLLKSGVGVFGIFAGAAMFFPVIIECLVWVILINVAQSFSEMFDVCRFSAVFWLISSLLTTLLSVLFCSLAVFTVSTALILIMGG